MAAADLRVTSSIVIPERELGWRFDPAGGPGGQHANRSSTRAELSWNVDASGAVDDETKRRLIGALGGRVHDGVVIVSVDESRSQWRNRQLARRRLAELVAAALRPPKSRHRTKPTGASRLRRLEAKRARSETKRLRGRPPIDDG